MVCLTVFLNFSVFYILSSMSLQMYLIESLEFQIRINEFEVENINPNAFGALKPKWIINNTVRNPIRLGLYVIFNEIKCVMYFKEDGLFLDRVTAAYSKPFTMKVDTRSIIEAVLLDNHMDMAILGPAGKRNMKRDVEGGMLQNTYSNKMAVKNICKNGVSCLMQQNKGPLCWFQCICSSWR